MSQPGTSEFKLDSERWRTRGIKNLHAILNPTDKGRRQGYIVASAMEIHYEVSLAEVFLQVGLNNITLHLYINDDRNYKSSFCLVMNDQEYLKQFTKHIEQELTCLEGFFQNYGKVRQSTDGRKKRQQGAAIDVGIGSKTLSLYFIYLYLYIF